MRDHGECAPTVEDSFSTLAQSQTNGDICPVRCSPRTICGRELDSFNRYAQPWTLIHSAYLAGATGGCENEGIGWLRSDHHEQFNRRSL